MTSRWTKTLIPFILLVISLNGLARERTDHWHLRNDQFDSELDSIPKHGIVFLGNSITEGFKLDKYFPEVSTINRGIVADHLDGLIERLHNSAVGLEPRKIFLMIGINDIGDQRDDEYLKSMYTTLIDTLMEELPKTEIILHSILPTSPRWSRCPPAQIKRINSFLELMALERDLVYVNLYPYFLADMNYLNPDLTRDGLHPNAAGYDIWAEKIKAYVN